MFNDIRTITSPNQCLAWWLVHNYLYYEEGACVISDADWLQLGKWLVQSWQDVTHPNKNLVDITSITSSGVGIAYTERIKSCAMMVLRKDIAYKRRHYNLP